MLRGRFNDILAADTNYFAIDPDLSNADEAFRHFQDRAERQRMVDRTHELIMSEHTYAHRLATLRRTIEGS